MYGRGCPDSRSLSLAKVAPFHSIHPAARVYHDEGRCTEGNNIEADYRRSGTAGRPKCQGCRDISG
ncbi:MAG: hypothetical protein CVU47_01820 [Chloroflexi bacterium HGW-Chloroflexi-9]|nr:MAG: hypothetical protein CVU47_01820 [Chloroflexi bacterium HGW-Chloroflexi-9]